MAAEANFGGGTSAEVTHMLNNFWPSVSEQIGQLTSADLKNQELPLARIKKIMKLDEDVKMISAEAPVLFAQAAEIFICELSLRSWVHTEDNKRRTLQKNDVAMAISKYDQFDFLIDIVPRDELKPPTKRQEDTIRVSSNLPDQIQYYLQLAQQQQQQTQQQTPVQSSTAAPIQQALNPTTVQVPQPTVQVQQPTVQVQQPTVQVQQPVQVQQQVVQQQQQPVQQVVTQAAQLQQQTAAVQLPNGQIIQQPIQIQGVEASQPQIIQLQAPQGVVQQLGQMQQVQQVVASAPLQQEQQQHVQHTAVSHIPSQVTTVAAGQPATLQPTTQVYQQVITPSGEVQSIPIQLTPQQLQSIQMQLQEKSSAQNIVIQSSQPVDQSAQLAAASQQIYQIQQLPQQAQQIFIQQSETGDIEQTDAQET